MSNTVAKDIAIAEPVNACVWKRYQLVDSFGIVHLMELCANWLAVSSMHSEV
jgi:hypothetical protein